MNFFSNLGKKIAGVFKGIPTGVKGWFAGIAEWSVMTKVMAGTCAVTALVLVGATGVLAHDAIEKKQAAEIAAAEQAAKEAEEEAAAAAAAEKAALEAKEQEVKEVAEEEPIKVEDITVDLPTFVGCKLSSDSLEKDLTLYIKGSDSGKKISGTKFEVKLIDPNSKSQISKYVTDIDAITEKIAAAKKDGSYDKPSGKTLGEAKAELKNSDKKNSDSKKTEKTTTGSSTSKDDVELSKGEELLFQKEVAIASYKKALDSMKGDTYTDSDSDGMIYIKEIKSGDYIACFVPTGEYDAVDYMTKVNVKDKVEYKKVETIEDKTVSAAAAGDTKPAEAATVEAVLQDTVEFVQSTKTLVSGGSTQTAPATIAPGASNETTTEKEFTTTSRRSNGLRASAGRTGGFRPVAASMDTALVNLTVGGQAVSRDITMGDGETVTGFTPANFDTSIVTVGGSGSTVTFTPVAAGTTAGKITVTYTDSASASQTAEFDVSVTVADNSGSGSGSGGESGGGSGSGGESGGGSSTTLTDATMTAASTLPVNVGSTGTISLTTSGVASVSATSGDTSVVTVESAGTSGVVVKGVKAGKATITITGTPDAQHNAPDNVTCEVTVNATTTTAKASITVPSSVTLYAKDGLNSVTVTPKLTNASLKAATPVVSSDANVVTPTLSGSSIVLKGGTGLTSNGSATITYYAVCADGKTEFTATTKVTVIGSATPIKDSKGNALYTDEKCTKAATVANYAANGTFYVKGGAEEYKYTGWQTINGNSFYYDKNGNKITGTQVIQGVKYNFGTDGALLVSGTGIDVSKWQGNIDWAQTKSAVGFAIIRCGFRGSSGGIAVDEKFLQNAKNAKANGVKIGLYFYSRATTEAQAVEEASLAIQCAQQAGGLSYPIFIDMEDGAQAGLSNEQRTAIVNAFCQTVRNSGYSAGLYANKNWLTNKINTGSLSGVKIWCAQYNTTCTYGGHKDMWQYSSNGSVPGISTRVDMNISYF